MRFSRRDSRSKAVAGFWQWWSGVHGRVESAIATGQWGGLTDEVTARVSVIHPDLQWEFAPGKGARHALIVTAGGDPRLRALAARWYASAPPADDVWEYHPARQPDPTILTSLLEMADQLIRLQDTQFASLLDADRCQLDVVCYHPVFAQVPEQIQEQITFLALDWLLGEQAAELWIGGVAWQQVRPDDVEAPEALAERVAELAARYAQPVWVLLTARDGDDYPVIATIQQPLKPARWPRFDTHVAITLPYEPDRVGLPGDRALQKLRNFEDQLIASLGEDGALVAHESTRGRRILHVYADSESVVLQSVAAWAGREATVRQSHDPSFENVSHLRP
ncbi:MAG TPA: DUF695 domain-containing protein [Rugosimonospora sp.]|nr:DUF695 domain-containing protein [Rugosimonospora sp.]